VGSPGVVNLSQLELTTNAALDIGALQRAGRKVVLVTNQKLRCGQGLMTRNELDDIHNHLQTMLLKQDRDAMLNESYVCTSINDSGDPRMKPNPGDS
jgi:histidinol phosphatase-like enzyme